MAHYLILLIFMIINLNHAVLLVVRKILVMILKIIFNFRDSE